MHAELDQTAHDELKRINLSVQYVECDGCARRKVAGIRAEESIPVQQ